MFTARDGTQKLTRGRTRSAHRHVGCAAQYSFKGGGPAAVLSEIGLHGERSCPAAYNNEEAHLLRISNAVGGILSEAEPLNESVSQTQSMGGRPQGKLRRPSCH